MQESVYSTQPAGWLTSICGQRMSVKIGFFVFQRYRESAAANSSSLKLGESASLHPARLHNLGASMCFVDAYFLELLRCSVVVTRVMCIHICLLARVYKS